MIDEYLDTLRSELRSLGVADDRSFDEIRDHVTDAIEDGLRQGLSRDDAERAAVARVGDPATIARQLAANGYVTRDRPGYRRGSLPQPVAVALSVLAGLAIAYVDSRPHWDDAGITAFSMLGTALILGALAPRRPWLIALGVGVWIPLHAVARSGSPAALVMLVVLAFPLAGAYGGAAARRIMAPSPRG